MSTVNAATIETSFLTCNSISIGNSSSNLVITANSTYISFGANVYANSSAVYVGNSSANSYINSTALVANSITINGVTYTSTPSTASILSYNKYTTTGWTTWSKPAGATANDLVTIMVWGAGGGGNTQANGRGGGGGACVIVNKLASECNATCNVFVGTGGSPGLGGGNSVFWSNSSFSISGYGGGGAGNTTGSGGAGGGWFSAAVGNTPGGPLGGVYSVSDDSTFGGGSSVPGSSVYGGGGGGPDIGGNSVYGGAGGCRSLVATSIFGGNGGNSSISPTVPGGGGGANVAAYATGANGQIIVWVTKVG